MKPLIEFRDVSYWYPDQSRPALEELNLEVKEGEFLLVTGSSGSGKTTLLQCINGLVPRYSGGRMKGRVMVDGKPTLEYKIPELASKVGRVFQDPENQFIMNSVANELVFGLENLQYTREQINERVNEIVEELGLQKFLDRETSELSGGEKQKIILASILAMKPQVLVLDEPTSQLDEKNTKQILDLIVDLHQQGKTIVLVEHHLNKILDHVDRVFDIGKKEFIQPSELKAMKTRKKAEGKGKNNPVITVSNLTYSYGNGNVLDYLDLEIGRGEVTALVGSNGSGKSTLLKLFNGLLKPAEGLVEVNGIDTRESSVEELSRTVGYLPQNPNDYLFSETVFGEVTFTLKNFGLELSEERIDSLLDSLGILHLKHCFPRDLSGGERQRVALASVLAYNPDILLLDEPTLGIDEESRGRIRAVLEDLRVKGKTIVLATHDRDLVDGLADRVIELGDG